MVMWVWALWETFIILQYPGNVSMVSMGDIYHTKISSQCEYDLYGRHLSYYNILATWVWSLWETFIILQYPGNVSIISVGDIYHTTISSQCEYDLYGRHLSYYNILAMWEWSPWASCQIRKNCVLVTHREYQERFSRPQLQRKWLVSDPDMHHGTCVTHVPWCMSGSLTRGGRENVPGIPGACTTRNFTYLARGPWETFIILQYPVRCLWDTFIILQYPGNVSMISMGDIYHTTISWKCEYDLYGRHFHTTISWKCEYDLYGRHLSYYNIRVMWVWSLWEAFIILQYPGNVSMLFMEDIFILQYPGNVSMFSMEDIFTLLYPGNVSMVTMGDRHLSY